MASKAPGAGRKKPVKKTIAPNPRTVAPVVEEKAVIAAEPKALPAIKAQTPAVETPTVETPAVETIAEPPVAPAATEPAEAVVEPVAAAATVIKEIIEDTAPQMADTVAKGTDIMETTIEKTQAIFADLNDRAKAAVEKNTKLVSEATEFAKGNVEALVESGKIAAKGFETLGQDVAEYNRKSFESATATLKSLSSVKSPADFFKLQSDFVRQSFDSVVAETSKNTEAFIKLAGDAAQPISSRFAVAVEKVKSAA